jgi:L-aspartate oxidase
MTELVETDLLPDGGDVPEQYETDVLVIGSGIAGCAAALAAARDGANVLVATKAERPEDAATDWAQGGIAVTQSEPETFADDIRAAGADENDDEAVEVLVQNAREAVEDVLLDTLDVDFDTDATGDDLDLGQEAAHSERRILHVDGTSSARSSNTSQVTSVSILWTTLPHTTC